MYIISDTHWYHDEIIRYCQRPFNNGAEMTEMMIKEWNDAVKEEDAIVLHLGDVTFDYGRTFKVMHRLKGQKKLVRGNHDYGVKRMEALGFEVLTERRNQSYEFEYGGRRFVVAHRPRDIPTWTEDDLRIRFSGHEHNNAPMFIKWTRDKRDDARPIMTLNMSCEWWSYRPAHIDVLIKIYDGYVRRHK